MSRQLVFLGMGGTIAGVADSASDNVTYRAAQLGIDQLLRAIPPLGAALGAHQLVSEQVAQLDSKDMGFSQWARLAQRVDAYLRQAQVRGVVITHGTDTLEETAYFLSRVLPLSLLECKPVVLVCAMRPASSVAADGPQNILDAVALACTAGAKGVMVVCAGTIHCARNVQKVHPYRLNAFDSGDAGPLGYVEEGVVRLVQSWPPAEALSPPMGLEEMQGAVWPRVELVTSHAGATGATIRMLCATPLPGDAPVRGIVVAGTGNGSVHCELEAALLVAQTSGIEVRRSTRCAWGRVLAGAQADNNLMHSNGLAPVKARIALMLELMLQPHP